MKTKHFLFALALLAGLVGWGLYRGTTAKASNGFTCTSLQGVYGYTVQGTIGMTTPLAAMGVLTADGKGGISGTETLQVYGQGTQVTQFQGSYSVDAGGTGTMIINYPALPAQPITDPDNPPLPPPAPVVARYSFVIVNGVAELRGMRADNGIIATAAFRQQ